MRVEFYPIIHLIFSVFVVVPRFTFLPSVGVIFREVVERKMKALEQRMLFTGVTYDVSISKSYSLLMGPRLIYVLFYDIFRPIEV